MEIRVPIGKRKTKKFTVREEHLASFLGSGNVNVLSTPQMIAWMENVSRELLDEYMPKGYTTVGYHVDIYHLKPAPLGSEVDVTAEIVSQEKRKIKLKVKAQMKETIIGEGYHERYIINLERFADKTKK